MFKHFLVGILAIAVLCAGLVATAVRAADALNVSDAWVRTPAPGQKVAGAYMELVSDRPAALTGVTSAAAGRAELHAATMEAGVMRMRPVESIDLPAKKPVTLAPGGLHIMLMDLKRPLKEGDQVPLVLSVRRGDATLQVKIEAAVRAAAGSRRHH